MSGLIDSLTPVKARPATKAELCLVHTPEHVENIQVCMLVWVMHLSSCACGVPSQVSSAGMFSSAETSGLASHVRHVDGQNLYHNIIVLSYARRSSAVTPAKGATPWAMKHPWPLEGMRLQH